jgi:hypothetical protein
VFYKTLLFYFTAVVTSILVVVLFWTAIYHVRKRKMHQRDRMQMQLSRHLERHPSARSVSERVSVVKWLILDKCFLTVVVLFFVSHPTLAHHVFFMFTCRKLGAKTCLPLPSLLFSLRSSSPPPLLLSVCHLIVDVDVVTAPPGECIGGQ